MFMSSVGIPVLVCRVKSYTNFMSNFISLFFLFVACWELFTVFYFTSAPTELYEMLDPVNRL